MSNDNERNMDEKLTTKQNYRLDKIEKKIDKLDKKLDKHIKDIWTVYEPIKKILEKLERFKLW
tara:strand:+ start:39 stop:227 length:189 start_codon:yes stop_codon:yes gene_type:complete